MTIKGSAILIVLVVSLASCSNRQTGEVSVKEDLIAKQLLQGIWVNDETEMPLMRIEGDTVYYANPQSAPYLSRLFTIQSTYTAMNRWPIR